jgi:hypothetical protein
MRHRHSTRYVEKCREGRDSMRWCVVVALTLTPLFVRAADTRHDIPKDHPRLFGNIGRLQALAQARPNAYKHVVDFAHHKPGYRDYEESRVWCNSICYALEHEKDLARKAIDYVMKECITGPIKVGHTRFGNDLAQCAVVYDLCYDAWTPDERNKFIEYMNKTIDANVNSETSTFHNGYYGYKNWGIGMACYATYQDNAKAPGYLKALEADIRNRAEPSLEQAGDGGGWAEGHYINYWLLEWLTFCEVARTCEGIDYYSHAPKFFRYRAIAGMFEMFPGGQPRELNCAIPMGDGDTGVYGGHSDTTLTARRILASYYRDDPAHQCVNAYNEQVTGVCIPEYAHLEFLFGDLTIPKGNLKAFKLSHCSPGPGYVYARSSWEHDSSYLFFKCGDRFTAHQHLDVGTFTIYKNAPLVLPGGYYDDFSGNHACNYYIRTIGCNSMLIFDPTEKFPDGIRAGPKSFNDGGQRYPMPKGWGQNWGALDKTEREKNIADMHLADLLAYDDQGSFMYTAGDCSKAYAASKCDFFTRQIVYIRPDTIVIFDRVQAKNPNFKKTFLLHTMKAPSGTAPNLVVNNGKGRLYIQTVLPAEPEVKLHTGKDLYAYNGSEGAVNPAKAVVGNIPECRVEISPKTAAQTDYFLHVLTTGDDTTPQPPKPECKVGSDVALTVGNTKLRFKTSAVGGSIEINGSRFELTSRLAIDPLPPVHAGPAPNIAAASAQAPADAPRPKSAEPSAECKALSAQRYTELRTVIIAGASAGKKEAVTVDIFNAPTNAKVVGADQKGISVAVEGLGDAIAIPWDKLDGPHFYQVARRYSEDHRALFEFCEGAGMSKEADSEATK